MFVCVLLCITRKNLDNQGKRNVTGKTATVAMGKLVARVNFSTKTQKKRKEFCRKIIIEVLADVQTVINVNNDIDLSAGGMNNDINSIVASMSNIDSSVNSANNDIQNIADISTASERKTVDIDKTTDQSSSGYVSKLTGFRFLDLEILSAVVSVYVSSLCCCSTCNQAPLSLSENFSRKKGLDSALATECSLCYYINYLFIKKFKSI